MKTNNNSVIYDNLKHDDEVKFWAHVWQILSRQKYSSSSSNSSGDGDGSDGNGWKIVLELSQHCVSAKHTYF